MARLHPHVLAIIEETGETDAVAAIRVKARSLVERFHALFPSAPPFNLSAMASFRGLKESNEAPRYSDDSEIAPDSNGCVILRVNRDRPRTRQRFSVGHEIGHTLFPDFEQSVQCRKARHRDWADPDDVLESLCDVAASEFLFPGPWFQNRVSTMPITAEAIIQLASDFQASPDATARRFVEVHAAPMAAVSFTWKLKPTEVRSAKVDQDQMRIFDDDELPTPKPKIRVDFAIPNTAFKDRFRDPIPRDKSIPSEGPIHEASRSGYPTDGTVWLDFGKIKRTFAVHAIPIFTPRDVIGPAGEVSVIAVLQCS